MLMFRLFLVLSLLISCTKKESSSELMSSSYIGSKSCKSCHQMEYSKWETSHHFRSMNEASAEFVLGDFNSRTLNRGGLVHKLYRKGDNFYALTDGPSGKLEEFEIKYTFGFKPIQQYLVQLPKGKLQVLALTWDVEKKEWFYMTDEIHKNQSIDHTNWLHWSRQSQNWNGMCAD